MQAERARLSAALDEANHAHRDEVNLLNSRLEALQARGTLTENLLEEARQALVARAEEMRTFDRRVTDASTTNDTLAERLSSVEALLAERELQIRDLEQARTLLAEEAHKLIQAATSRERTYRGAQESIREKNDLVDLLEEQITAARSTHEMQIESLAAQLQREQLERSMAEGALETARKDVSRLQQEVGALRSRIVADGGTEERATPDLIKRAA